MTLVTFDVVAVDVMAFLAQWQVSNVTKPGTGNITAKWIQEAAAEINEALLQGGYSVTSCADSVNYPIAYQRCKHNTAFRAALYYAQSLKTITRKKLEELWEQSNKFLEQCRESGQLGEIENTTGVEVAKFVHGTTSIADLNESRSHYNDEL